MNTVRSVNASRFTFKAPALRRGVIARAAAPQDPQEVPAEVVEESPVIDSNVSPVTGNPQTGKLIDVYFEVGSILLVVALSFWSMYNVKDIVSQTSQANAIREPANKSEWIAMDNKSVYGPCGGSQESFAALEDLMDGKACPPAEYARAAK